MWSADPQGSAKCSRGCCCYCGGRVGGSGGDGSRGGSGGSDSDGGGGGW